MNTSWILILLTIALWIFTILSGTIEKYYQSHLQFLPQVIIISLGAQFSYSHMRKRSELHSDVFSILMTNTLDIIEVLESNYISIKGDTTHPSPAIRLKHLRDVLRENRIAF